MSDETHELSYDLGGHRLLVVTASDDLRTSFDRSYAGFRAENTDGDIGFHLELEEGDLPEPPAGFRLVFNGPIPNEGRCSLFASDERTHLVFPNDCVLRIDRRERRGRITVAPGRADRLRGTTGIAAIEAAADAAGQIMLHAAGLTLPGDERCIVIHAPSGTGKSTTALALMHSGFGLCSDDALFAGTDEGGIFVWGFPSDVKVHRHTLKMMPWLEPVLAGEWNKEDERPIRWKALPALGRIEDRTPRRIAALFRLARAQEGETEIVSVGRAEVLASLAADNVRTGLTGLLPLQQRRFNMLARLVASVPVYELRAGRDLTDLARVISAKLGEAVPPKQHA
jgi:hypothetical protein